MATDCGNGLDALQCDTIETVYKLQHFNCIRQSRMLAQIEVRKCLLSFGAESFVFQVAIQKFKD
jgi:hypothetical protein